MSLSSISSLALWLDATDLSTISISPAGTDVIQWNDKSSNAYQFVPVRSNDRPGISTNGTSSVAILFNQSSSFQLMSKTKVAPISTLDMYCVVTPYSLLGPRQAIFDSPDITLCETDGRFNTQIYADGSEFFRAVPTPVFAQGTAIFKGELFLGSFVNQSPNYLQRYDSVSRSFNYFGPAMSNSTTKALAVFDGKLFTSSDSVIEYYNPLLDRFVTSNMAVSTISTQQGATGFPNIQRSQQAQALVVHKRELYVTNAGWYGQFTQNQGTSFPISSFNFPQLYKISSSATSSALQLVTNFSLGGFRYNNQDSADWRQFTSNMFSWRGDIIMSGNAASYGDYTTRFNGTTVNQNAFTNVSRYPTVYYGNLIFPVNDGSRMFIWNDNVQKVFARAQYGNGQNTSPGSGGMVAYRGRLFCMANGFYGNAGISPCNVIQSFSFSNGPFSNALLTQVGTNSIMATSANAQGNLFMSNLMIVHDGKLFVHGGAGFGNSNCFEYGNGTTLDRPFSTLVGAPILVNIRKSANACQMYLNGTLVESEYVNFTYANQYAREMFIGGAAGLLCAGMSDQGSDHMEGAIHSVVQYSSNLSNPDRQKVDVILAWQFGIQNVLPPSHPFYSVRPT
jgi:hypothetical protein